MPDTYVIHGKLHGNSNIYKKTMIRVFHKGLSTMNRPMHPIRVNIGWGANQSITNDITLLINYQNIKGYPMNRDGYLKGTYGRNEIEYQELQMKKTMGINNNLAKFKKNLTVARASALYNVHGGSYSCQCKGACTVEARCTCQMNNVFCTSKCHRERGGNKLCWNSCVHEEE